MSIDDIEIGMRVHSNDCGPDVDQGYVVAINYITGLVEVSWQYSCQISDHLASGLEPGFLE